jgi:hypothetical protein
MAFFVFEQAWQEAWSGGEFRIQVGSVVRRIFCDCFID